MEDKQVAGGSSSSKKKKVHTLEPRTPLKRQRVPVQRFQSPAEELVQPPKAKTPKEEVELVYKRGVFLAVRGAEGTFYLCRTQQNVFQNTKHFKIQWLDQNLTTKVYKFDFLDHTEIECVLTNVRMDYVAREQYSLPDSEKERIEMILTKALKKEKGEPYEDDPGLVNQVKAEDEDGEEDEDENDEDWEDEPTPKKRRVKSKSKKSLTVALKAGKDSKDAKKKAGKGKATKKDLKSSGKKKPAKKKPEKTERKRGPDRKLKPNLKIKILEKDPLFETKDHVPFISKVAHQRLVFRAVLQKDLGLLKQLLDDEQHIYNVHRSRSVVDGRGPIQIALENNDVEIIKVLIKDEKLANNPRLRSALAPPPILLNSMDTGSYNPLSLGIPNVRQLTVSRGSREGNEAFLKDDSNMSSTVGIKLKSAISKGVKKETLDTYISTSGDNYMKHQCYNAIQRAVIRGHRELAGKLMEDAIKNGGFGFNALHSNVLTYNNEDLGNVLAASARKKPFDNGFMTPIHCACINPNTKYLDKLLSVEPDINIEDKFGCKPIHYAAACKGTGPLESLLKKGANPNDVSRKKFTPLLFACYAGRPENAELLIKKGQSEESNPMMEKFGPGGLNQPNWRSVCPIHVAVKYANKELLTVLLKYGVNVNKPLSAGKGKLSPLMIAAARGHLDMARRLVQSGAVVEQLDKHKRSALTHAVMNGNANVTSYLLYLGSDPDRKDSSGNSLVHYAAAYGWYFVLKLLVNEGGANAAVANDWQMSPLGIAFMKGHTGLVDFLLKMPGVDINFKNDRGMTLISVACNSRLTAGLIPQVEYLLEKGADPTITDINGCNALHLLCGNHDDSKNQNDAEVISVKIAQLLIKAGCDPKAKTNNRHTAVTIAIAQLNIKLVKFLIEKGGSITTEKNDRGQNSLHTLAEQCTIMDLTSFITILSSQTNHTEIKENGIDEKMEVDEPIEKDNVKTDKIPLLKRDSTFKSTTEALKQMATEVDHDGYTPLLIACKVFIESFTNHYNKDPDFGLAFVKNLLDTTDIDCTQAVQKKFYKDEEEIPKNETDQYDHYGKYTPVHFMTACSDGPDRDKALQGLKLVLKYKCNLEARNLHDQTATVIAVENGDTEKLRLLLEAGASANVSYKESDSKDAGERTLLTTATERGKADTVKLLVEAKADVKNSRDSKTKYTSLHCCIRSSVSTDEKIALAGYLLNEGADISAVDAWKRSCLHLAISMNSGNSDASTDLEEFLIQKKALLFQKCALERLPLHYAFEKADRYGDSSSLDPIELCTILTLAMGDKQVDDPDKYGLSPLHLAAQRGASICCLHLLQRKAEINRKAHNNNTPLAIAVSKGHDSCAIILIQKGAEVVGKVSKDPLKIGEEKTEEVVEKSKPVWKWKHARKRSSEEEKPTYTIFQESISRELQGVAHMLLDAGEIDAKVIEAAIKVSRFNVVLRLLKRVRDVSTIQRVNEKGQNLLHSLVLYPGNAADTIKVAQVLLQKGVSLSQVDHQGCTPLHFAALKHSPYTVAKFYVESNMQLDALRKDKFDRDVLAAFLWKYESIVMEEENRNWLQLLLSKGCSLDMLYDFPLPDYPTFDCKGSDVPDYFTTTNTYKVSPLIMAIISYNFSLAKFCLENGASPNFADSKGITPLMHAVRKNDEHMVMLLLNREYEAKTVDSNKPALVKNVSRTLFNILPTIPTLGALNEGSEKTSVEEDSENEQNDTDSNVSEADKASGEGSIHEDVSEDGTDIVNDDDDEEKEKEKGQFPSLVRLESIQPLRQPSKPKSLGESSTSIENMNKVEVNATDNQGWTVLHHLVCPLEWGTYDNEHLLGILTKIGADHQKKDNAGLSPLDYALMKGASGFATKLQTLAGVEKEKHEKATFSSFYSEPDHFNIDKVDYVTDSEEILKQMTQEAMETSACKEKEQIKPDRCCNIKDLSEVVYDEVNNQMFDVSLTKVDVSYGTYGLYNFYKMQLLRQKGLDLYVLFTRWGRIGDYGQHQHTPFQKRAEAETEFAKIFRSKTGNNWSSMKSFVKQPKKYQLIHWEPKSEVKLSKSLNTNSEVASKLPHYLQDLIREMSDVNMMEAATSRMGIETDFMNLKKENLEKAREILQQVGDLIKHNDSIQSGSMDTKKTELFQSNCEKIALLSNDYYSLVPVEDYSFDRIPPISDKEVLKQKLDIIHGLLDMHCAFRIMLGAQSKLKSMNPLDYIYRAIGCKIQLLQEDSVEAQYVLKYIFSSDQNASVHAIYKLSREGEEERIQQKKLGNHLMLWHGSNMANFMSILHQGLLVAPPGAPITGNLFGQGIYTSDAFNKSRGYCSNYNPKSNTCLALLCEVALGECMENDDHNMDTELADTDYNSKHIIGRMVSNDEYDVVLPIGSKMPLGMLEEKHDTKSWRYYRFMQYSEFIVQDPSQICLRYMVEFK